MRLPIFRHVAAAMVMLSSLSGAAAIANPSPAKESVLYKFQGGRDGQSPMGSLLADAHGNLFGVTYLGGNGSCTSFSGSSCGTVFELKRKRSGDWEESVLYSFQGGTDGLYPFEGLVADANGNLYGTTSQGGTGNCSNMNLSGCGTVFELSRQRGGTWTETVLYSFQGNPAGTGNGDAALPNSLVFDRSENLFGYSNNGGSCTSGTRVTTFCGGAAFELQKKDGAWQEKIIYFAAGQIGVPAGALFDAQGNLYGTSILGGSVGVGAVFMLSPSSGKGKWTLTVLYSFQNSTDGALPVAGMVFDSQGNLYGASEGSDSVSGNVFELSPGPNGTWTESVVISFGASNNGIYPASGPIMDSNGNLAGTTQFGGTSDDGVAYKVLNSAGTWSEKVLHDFAGGHDGSQPYGGLIEDGGNLFGTTSAGGTGSCTAGCGTVFSVAE